MKASLFLFMCAMLSICSAQTFQKTYGDSVFDVGSYFIQGDNSSFHLLTTANHYLSPARLSVLKVNQFGDSLSSIEFQSANGRYNSACINCENEFAFVWWKDSMIGVDQYLDTLYIDQVDTLGNITFSWSYPDTFSFSISRIIKTSDGGYLVAVSNWNSQFNSNVLFMKVDSTGNLQWKKNLIPYTLSGQNPVDLMETPDHFYIAEIFQSSGSNWAGSKVMLKLDSFGNEIWVTTLTYGYSAGLGQQIVSVDSGYLYVDNTGYSQSSTYNSRIGFVDTSGVLQWSRIFSDENVQYRSIHSKISGGYYLCGVQKDVSSVARDIIITTLNEQADSVSSFNLGFNPGYEDPTYFKQLNDGRICIVGRFCPSFGSNSREYNIYFSVCDTLGNVTGIKSVYSDISDVVIYPNPTSGRFIISNNQFPIRELEIINAIGEKIYFEKMNSNSKSLELNLSSGIYFVRVSNEEKFVIRKLIVN